MAESTHPMWYPCFLYPLGLGDCQSLAANVFFLEHGLGVQRALGSSGGWELKDTGKEGIGAHQQEVGTITFSEISPLWP